VPAKRSFGHHHHPVGEEAPPLNRKHGGDDIGDKYPECEQNVAPR
jgi:hypothetical protein